MNEFASGLASFYGGSTAGNFLEASARRGDLQNVAAGAGSFVPNNADTRSLVESQSAQNSDPSLARISAQRYELEARVEQQNSFDLQLVTQDGDVVSIEFNLAKVLEFSEYQSQTSFEAINGSSFFSTLETESRSSLSFASFRDLDIQVIGELDTGELKALDELFADLDELSQLFFGGDLAQAQGFAQSFQLDTSEFTRIDLELGSQASFTAVESYRSIQSISGANSFAAAATPSTGSASLFDLLNQAESRIQQFSEAQQLELADQSYQDLLSLFLNSVEEQLERQFTLLEATELDNPDAVEEKNADPSIINN